MYISPRHAQLRNLIVATFTSTITLIILLIAPLGLAAVIINTLLVALATYIANTVSDRIIAWLHPVSEAELLSEVTPKSVILRSKKRNISIERSR